MNFVKVCLFFVAFIFLSSNDILAQAKVSFDQKAGFYAAGIEVKLSSNVDNAVIKYTINGASPVKSGRRYRKPIRIDSTTVLRAVAVVDGVVGKQKVRTFLIDEDSINLPVVSIGIAPFILFDPVKGIFKKGPKASPRFPHKGANYYSRGEYDCSVEFFETNKKQVFSGGAGFKVFGGMSRIFPQKSFALYARKSKYGNKHLKHQIFPDKKQKKYKRIVMRNSGSDFGGVHFKDAFITSLGKELGLEVQAYRPSVVFINGAYWGIYNFREKLNKHYIAENFGYAKDSVDLIEHKKSIQAGSRKHYDAMQAYMRTHDLSVQAHFDKVASMMDVYNFMDYQIMQIYADNRDAGGNIKFWRPQTATGKWRWILFDTDFGFGHSGKKGYNFNTLAFHTAPDGPAWPNPAWSTFNLRMLLKNKGFRDEFVRRFTDCINVTFDSTKLVGTMDSFAAGIKPQLPRHIQRWDLSERRWEKVLLRMKEFARLRPLFMRKHIQEMYPYVGKEIQVELACRGEGTIVLNKRMLVTDSLSGIYFKNLPLDLTVRNSLNAQFAYWLVNGDKVTTRALIYKLVEGQNRVVAVFEEDANGRENRVVINEVAIGDTSTGDWVEFFNASDLPVNLSGWSLEDADGKMFVFPEIELSAQSYLVVCRDVARFRNVHVSCKHFIGGLPFGISQKRDKLALYDAAYNPIDLVAFDIKRDSMDASPVIALADYDADNARMNVWKADEYGGSPASVNPEYIAQKEEKAFQQFLDYMKMGGITMAIFVSIVLSFVTVRKHVEARRD